MERKILGAFSFNLSGKFAHFRKFYTNASSLTYFIPPPTVIRGMLASILEIGRDQYYEKLDNISISVSITDGCNLKKNIQSVNYLHAKYVPYQKNLFFSDKKESAKPPFHSPTNFELLMPFNLKEEISYKIYLVYKDQASKELFESLKFRFQNNELGYGIYLGQRQFKADIDNLKIYDSESIVFMKESEWVDSAVFQDDSSPDLLNCDVEIINDQMPIKMELEYDKKRKEDGRKPKSVKRVIYEKAGKRLKGKFSNCYEINDKHIAFLGE